MSPPWMWDVVCAEGHLCTRAFVREEEGTLCGICVGEIEFFFFRSMPAALVGFGAFVWRSRSAQRKILALLRGFSIIFLWVS